MGDVQPRMRAGDEDRQRVVEQLGRHFGEGRLTVEEFDDRVVRAYAAVHLDELPPLTADLPAATQTQPQPRPQPQRHRPTRSPMRVPSVVVVLAVLLLAWSMVVAVAHGAPPFPALVLVFLFLRHRRWSRRW